MNVSVHPLQRLSGQWLNLQPRIAKWPIRVATIFTAALLAASCVPPAPGPGPIQGPGPGHGPGWSGSESSAYRAGHSDGSRDKRQGRKYNPYYGRDRFPPASRDSYVQGYNAGYRNANDNPWSQRRAYELGQDRGRSDRQAGRPMNPDRHSGEVPRAVRNDFNRGYRDGWNSVRPGPGRPPISPRPTPY
ncbi:hypothetical protein [Luteolibacter luteus]|uniref:Uncharacterized protein n=1 Tax=Luteolibacter luteus TaxID=2728835 RepID=A0A858RH70_9BACT|nr:hypothetical protein [Luteolibacter luteus]QJE96516.1 hypothetical protein HHL09_12240 [Luteolibacter luteus]